MEYRMVINMDVEASLNKAELHYDTTVDGVYKNPWTTEERVMLAMFLNRIAAEILDGAIDKKLMQCIFYNENMKPQP